MTTIVKHLGKHFASAMMTAGLITGLNLAAAPVSAITLVDGNSSIEIDDDDFTIEDWEVDGVFHLYEEIFFFNTGRGPGRAENPFSDFELIERSYSDNMFSALLRGFNAEISLMIELVGGALGSGVSNLYETVTITNLGGGQGHGGGGEDEEDEEEEGGRPIRLFAYTDFDLADTSDDDTVSIVGNTAMQTDPTRVIGTVSVSQLPTAVGVSEFSDILDSLEDGSRTTLTNFAGPLTRDATFAFQWDIQLRRNQSFAVTLHKQITPNPEPESVPEPASALGLLTFGLLGAGSWRKRQTAPTSGTMSS